MTWLTDTDARIAALAARDADAAAGAFWEAATDLAVMATRKHTALTCIHAIARAYALRGDTDGLRDLDGWSAQNSTLQQLHYAPIAQARMLKHKADRIMEHVIKHPGCEQRECVFAADMRPSELRDVMRDMDRLGVVARTRSGSSFQVFPATTKSPRRG